MYFLLPTFKMELEGLQEKHNDYVFEFNVKRNYLSF